MKRSLLVLLAVVCMLMMAGCKRIDYGTVVDKSFSPAHNTYLPMVVRAGKSTRVIPRWIHYSDRWAILVENEDGKDWWDVSENYYNSIEIGDAVDRR